MCCAGAFIRLRTTRRGSTPGAWRSGFEMHARITGTRELPMSVEFIGFITNNNSSETIVRTGPVLDRRYIETVAKAHETAGFDRALIARQLATVDQLSGGRVALHVITGGNATELKQDGNTIDDKDERYARTDEFLDVVRLEWTSEKPFSYNGKYYPVQNG